jgi:hypothetical protein
MHAVRYSYFARSVLNAQSVFGRRAKRRRNQKREKQKHSSLHRVLLSPRIGHDNYLNAMNASPNSPPTMCTPPSGILRPLKNWRISNALADHARFCSLIITLIFAVCPKLVSATEPRSNEIKRRRE